MNWVELELTTSAWWAELRGMLPKLRTEAGISQRKLSRVLNTRQSNISAAERGGDGAVWGIDRVIAWLAALGYVIAATSPEEEDVVLLDHWDAEVGRWMAGVRLIAGISQEGLAHLLGVAVSTVQTVEHRGSAARVTTVIGWLIACGWAVDVRRTDSRTPIPGGPTAAEDRKVWRQRARGRALTRLARERREEYTEAYRFAQSSAGRGPGLSAQRARDAALASLALAHGDRFRAIYREELIKGDAPSGMTGGVSQGKGGVDQAARP